MTAEPRISGDDILDAALAEARETGWEAMRLAPVARRLGVGLRAVQRHFREKDELIDARLDRADRAMLAVMDTPGFADLPSVTRLHRLLMAWFEDLQCDRSVVQGMLAHKMEFGHIHVQFPLLLRVSRTVQWWREAADRSGVHLERALEETALTTLFLSTVVRWLRDPDPTLAPTRRFLQQGLERLRAVRHALPPVPGLARPAGVAPRLAPPGPVRDDPGEEAG
ncbi:TetR/AcrR family transcriptional regulator [Alkalilimnicola ehrlichii]|uniref:TetR/AcrR family transcriptional regulator n=1 Tax=Alkalilimnicola ehrlichii TaxID=351052 RepID=UPI003BA17AFF